VVSHTFLLNVDAYVQVLPTDICLRDILAQQILSFDTDNVGIG